LNVVLTFEVQPYSSVPPALIIAVPPLTFMEEIDKAARRRDRAAGIGHRALHRKLAAAGGLERAGIGDGVACRC